MGAGRQGGLARRRWIIAAALMLGGTATACGGDAGSSSLPTPSGSSTSGTSTESGTPSASDDQQALLAQYRQFWQVSGSPLNDVPVDQLRDRLSPYAVDPQLSTLINNVQSNRAKGIGTYGNVELRPTVVSMDDTTATIRDCQNQSQTGQLELKSGRKLTVGVAGSLVNVTMRHDGQVWKVAAIDFADQRC